MLNRKYMELTWQEQGLLRWREWKFPTLFFFTTEKSIWRQDIYFTLSRYVWHNTNKIKNFNISCLSKFPHIYIAKSRYSTQYAYFYHLAIIFRLYALWYSVYAPFSAFIKCSHPWKWNKKENMINPCNVYFSKSQAFKYKEI